MQMLAETAFKKTLVVRHLGQQEYLSCWQAMQTFTNQRTEETLDELWLLEHPPVFTLGQSGKPEHILQTSSIPSTKLIVAARSPIMVLDS